MTLVEALVFGLIGIGILLTVVGMLTQGARLIGVGQETSATQTALRILLATMADDAAELVHLDPPGADYDSDGPGKFSFVIHSRRTERGLPATSEAGLRRVEYALEGSGKLKTCVRTVTKLDGQTGTTRREVGREAFSRLRIFPVTAYRNTGAAPGQPRYFLTRGSAGPSSQPGSTVACLVVDVEAGEGVLRERTEIERAPITAVVTKLWCRNRVLELGRGGLR